MLLGDAACTLQAQAVALRVCFGGEVLTGGAGLWQSRHRVFHRQDQEVALRMEVDQNDRFPGRCQRHTGFNGIVQKVPQEGAELQVM